MRYLVTKMCDGSIVDFGHIPTSEAPAGIKEALNKPGVIAVTIDRDNGTRVRYEQ